MIYTPILKYHEGSADYFSGNSRFICADKIKEIFGRTPPTIRFEISEQPREGWQKFYISFPHWRLNLLSLWTENQPYTLFHQHFKEWILKNLEYGSTYWVRMVTNV